MSGRRPGRPSDPELLEARTRITTLEEQTAELEKSLHDKDTEIQELERKLEAAGKSEAAVKAEADGTIETLRKEGERLRLQHSELDARVQEADTKYTTIERQYNSTLEEKRRLQSELQSAQGDASRYNEETKILNAQLSEALKDLTLTREELLKERDAKEQLHESQSKSEAALEAMMAEIREQEEKGVTVGLQLWLTAAVTVCGTACVISLLFMKYYSSV